MKPKKLEKRVQFIFKKTNMVNLTNEQMRRINGGDGATASGGDISTNQGCAEQKTLVTIGD